MTITERTLKRYRRKALQYKEYATAENIMQATPQTSANDIKVLADCILKMTQELLDQHLLRRT